jgi:hypothetical protein
MMPLSYLKKVNQQIHYLFKNKEQEKKLLKKHITVQALSDLIHKWERKKANLDAEIMHPQSERNDAINEGKIQILSECLKDLKNEIRK